MEIPSGHNYNFLMQTPIPKGNVDQFGVEVFSQQNAFVTSPLAFNDKNSGQKKQRKKSKKRLNAYDNELLYSDEVADTAVLQVDPNNFFMQSDFHLAFQSFLNTIKRTMSKLPIINFFILKEKKKIIEKSIRDLNNINEDVDELVSLSAPYGEQGTKYDALCENLMKANNIHSNVLKKLK